MMTKAEIDSFKKLDLQIRDIYRELSILSKKAPDGAINKFKLNLINQLIEESNDFLEDEDRPFNDFILFEEDDIPTNSDVVLILSQYIRCLGKYEKENVY